VSKKNHSATCVETMKQSHFLERDGTKEVNATKSWLTACSPLIHEFRNNKNNKNKQTELLHFSLSTIVLNYCDNHFPSSVVECHYKFPMSYYLEASDQCKTVIIIIICQINFDWQFFCLGQSNHFFFAIDTPSEVFPVLFYLHKDCMIIDRKDLMKDFSSRSFFRHKKIMKQASQSDHCIFSGKSSDLQLGVVNCNVEDFLQYTFSVNQITSFCAIDTPSEVFPEVFHCHLIACNWLQKLPQKSSRKIFLPQVFTVPKKFVNKTSQSDCCIFPGKSSDLQLTTPTIDEEPGVMVVNTLK
jgi:hypothetical protein